MGYLISELLPKVFAENVEVKLVNEQSFDRLARITSVVEGKVCVFLGDKSYIRKLPVNTAMVITKKEIAEQLSTEKFGLCICDKPKILYNKILSYINQNAGIKHIKTIIGKDCVISKHAVIADENVVIGDNVTIEDFVVVYPNTVIGDRCIIRAGAKIGIQDYNYYNEGTETIHLYHAGRLVIEDNAEIGYNSVVGKALYLGDNTVIGKNTKISHNCSIGHDVQLGANTMIYSGSVIGGYTVIGDNAHVTMNATIKNAVRVGENAMVCMGSNVLMNVKDGAKVFGNPARKLKI